ncbi:MAG TPA: hypothetical protein VJC05_01655 [Candidatus Andersenbacteria bacterium]|nr:hypothetical protein [Candidatus Andersenbacteria bacterium]
MRQVSFNEEQIGFLAQICAELGVVSVASIALPFLIDKYHPSLALLGISAAIFFWILGFFALSFKR